LPVGPSGLRNQQHPCRRAQHQVKLNQSHISSRLKRLRRREVEILELNAHDPQFHFVHRVYLCFDLSVSGFIHRELHSRKTSAAARVLLASADVEAKLGKGIFGSPPNRNHVKRPHRKRWCVLRTRLDQQPRLSPEQT